jgi:hypothetical protein
LRAKGKKLTLREQVKALRRDRRRLRIELVGCKRTIAATDNDIVRLRSALQQSRSEAAGWREKFQLRQEIDHAAYDMCASQVTSEERRLFEASPAYRQYRRWRAAREEAAPYSDAERARLMVLTGNGRAP